MIMPQVDYGPLYNAANTKRAAGRAALMPQSADLAGQQIGLQRRSMGIMGKSQDLQQQAFDLQNKAFEQKKTDFWVQTGFQIADQVLGAVSQVVGIIKERNFQQAKNDVLQKVPELQEARMKAIANGDYDVEYAPDGSILDVSMGDEYNKLVEDSINEISDKYNAFPEIKGWVQESITTSSNSQKIAGYQDIFAKESQMTMTMFESNLASAMSSAVESGDISGVRAQIDSAGFLTQKEKILYATQAQAEFQDRRQKKGVESFYRENGYSATMDGLAEANLSPERKAELSKFVTDIDKITQEQNTREDKKLDKAWEDIYSQTMDSPARMVSELQNLRNDQYGAFHNQGPKEHWIDKFTNRLKKLSDDYNADTDMQGAREFFVQLSMMANNPAVEESDFQAYVQMGVSKGYFDSDDAAKMASEIDKWMGKKAKPDHGLKAGMELIQKTFPKDAAKYTELQYQLAEWRDEHPNATESDVLNRAKQLIDPLLIQDIGEFMFTGQRDYKNIDPAEQRLMDLLDGKFAFDSEKDFERIQDIFGKISDTSLTDITRPVAKNLTNAWQKDFVDEMVNFKGSSEIYFDKTDTGGLIPIIHLNGTYNSSENSMYTVPRDDYYTARVLTSKDIKTIQQRAFDDMNGGKVDKDYWLGTQELQPNQEAWFRYDSKRGAWEYEGILGNRETTGARFNANREKQQFEEAFDSSYTGYREAAQNFIPPGYNPNQQEEKKTQTLNDILMESWK